MKNSFQFLIIILFGILLSSCTNKEKVYEGMYNGFNQISDMENDDQSTLSDKKHPTFQQYKKERSKISDKN